MAKGKFSTNGVSGSLHEDITTYPNLRTAVAAGRTPRPHRPQRYILPTPPTLKYPLFLYGNFPLPAGLRLPGEMWTNGRRG
jgi:hypothetical protein